MNKEAEFAAELCEALGLERVTRLELIFDFNVTPVITVKAELKCLDSHVPRAITTEIVSGSLEFVRDSK